MLLITGPNASGKSVYMKQVGTVGLPCTCCVHDPPRLHVLTSEAPLKHLTLYSFYHRQCLWLVQQQCQEVHCASH